ncbi:U3 small nucleolar ribonucleoprotein imp3 [Gracilariopsis chorda]|uniref:U3 small nucleolar ribonucleoprotein protein IMP3 n=1 Tax=Gracilariopsis chorda TaxID=448386 RepID=A0A2V3JCC8_9FLOR|nr:U3 small nucleolar ribonucleoprotein imp3 [Gracilariopsis chorda]|eukprot:PXF49970.1 U3 small nucleolar ribonucleoprotein imp3 [Gracilariopsis chorda]
MRKLKYHEYKLLRKADFLKWKRERNLREVKVARRYHLSNPEEYHQYSKIVGDVKQLCAKIQELKPDDPVRIQRTDDLMTKLYDMGIISLKSGLEECSKVTVSAICRRRLPVVMKRLKFAETLTEATTLIEQGHIRIGPTQVKDPAMLITRSMEDFVTWVDTSKIKRKVSQFNDNLDDYDLLNA